MRYEYELQRTITVLGPTESRIGKYGNCLNVSDGTKLWFTDWSNLHKWNYINKNIFQSNDNEHDNLPNNAETQVDDHNKLNEEINLNELINTEIKHNQFIISLGERDLETGYVYVTFNAQESDKFCSGKEAELNK